MEKHRIVITESQFKKIIKESVKRVLNESFNSKKLEKLAKEHGGLRKTSTTGASDYSDENIGRVLDPKQTKENYRWSNILTFNDDYGVEIIDDNGKFHGNTIGNTKAFNNGAKKQDQRTMTLQQNQNPLSHNKERWSKAKAINTLKKLVDQSNGKAKINSSGVVVSKDRNEIYKMAEKLCKNYGLDVDPKYLVCNTYNDMYYLNYGG